MHLRGDRHLHRLEIHMKTITPGDWHVGHRMNDGSITILDNCNGAQCIVASVHPNVTDSVNHHQRANANAIAALPDLLNVCNLINEAFTKWSSDDEDEFTLGEWLDKVGCNELTVRSALAKAAGDR